MCFVSYIGDHNKKFPWDYKQWPYPADGTSPPDPLLVQLAPAIESPSKEEFEKLKREVESLKTLLEKSKQYDIEHNEPHCEMEEKIALIKKVSETFGVDFSGLFDKSQTIKSDSGLFEPFHVIDDNLKVVAKFADLSLAEIFSQYVSEYSNKRHTVITVVENHALKFAVIRNGYLVARFTNETDVDDFITHDKLIKEATESGEWNYQIIQLDEGIKHE